MQRLPISTASRSGFGSARTCTSVISLSLLFRFCRDYAVGGCGFRVTNGDISGLQQRPQAIEVAIECSAVRQRVAVVAVVFELVVEKLLQLDRADAGRQPVLSLEGKQCRGHFATHRHRYFLLGWLISWPR